eukprot:COSAG01_NODE_12405_length_1746_cov_1.185185_3_plen_72_part_00
MKFVHVMQFPGVNDDGRFKIITYQGQKVKCELQGAAYRGVLELPLEPEPEPKPEPEPEPEPELEPEPEPAE